MRRRRWLVALGVLAVMAVVVPACSIQLIGYWLDADRPKTFNIAIDPPEFEERFRVMFDGASRGEQVGELRDLTDFDWDHAYVFSEYYDGKTIRQITGETLAEDHWSVQHLSCLFVFKNETTMVKAVWLRSVGFTTTKPKDVWPPDTRIIALGDHPPPGDPFYSFKLVRPGEPVTTTTSSSTTTSAPAQPGGAGADGSGGNIESRL